jgi:hypothetical protein
MLWNGRTAIDGVSGNGGGSALGTSLGALLSLTVE